MTTTEAPRPITLRQREVYDWIFAFIEERGYSPTTREIMLAFGWSTPNATMCHLLPLRKKGYVDWMDRSPRTLRPLKGGAL